MFNYIIIILVIALSSNEAQAKKQLINKPGSCVVEDTWHPVTGEKLGKRVRCGL
jgi:hypothetical protein